MASPNWGIVSLHFLILTHLSVLAIAQRSHQCGTQGNYTHASAYRRNLDEALNNLNETFNGNGFSMSFSNLVKDDNPSTAHALALCRGDLDSDTCLRCVTNATRWLRRDCPNQMKATGWYDSCILSYSNSTLSDVVDDDVDATYLGRLVYYSHNENIVPGWGSFNQTLSDLFQRLRGEAARGGSYKKYASGSMRVGGSVAVVYGIMQCSPVISQRQCDECLVKANKYLPECCNGSGEGRVYYQYSCFLRYARYQFYNETASMPQTPAGKKRSKRRIIGPAVAVAAAALMVVVSVFSVRLKAHRIRREKEKELYAPSDDDTGEMIYFRLSEMNAATSNFSLENKLGEGGFGSVYSGELSDGKKIAVKRLSQSSSQGLQEFKTEVNLIMKLQHKNLVRLLGCCIKGNERLLVYEYMANSSLDTYLFDQRKGKELDWAKRMNIVNGIAKGLRYLHEDSRLKIIHRDLKASNVLLDEEMNPKISDFGTAKIFGLNQVEDNTARVVGTYGYMAPEYAMEGQFSIKSDVYSFGILLLEIISGKRNIRFFHHDHNLLSYAWMLRQEGEGEQLIDENLKGDCSIIEAIKWMDIALLCIQQDPRDRPTMSSIVFMLEGQWTSLLKPKPSMSYAKIIFSNNSSSMSSSDDVTFFSSHQNPPNEGH